jgi:glycosyltransferase involved in cell wall biosynthesis
MMTAMSRTDPGPGAAIDSCAEGQRPSVAAIFPGYNESAQSIERTVAGVLTQTAPPSPVVLIDDASPTALSAPPQFDTQVDVIRLSENAGISAGRNHGAASTDSDYLLFVNSDVVLERHWVQRAREFMDAHDSAGAVSGTIVPVVGPRLLRKWRLQFIETKTHRSALTGPAPVTWIVGHVFFVRREAFDAIGGFDPRFRSAGEDWDLSQRLLAAGYDLFHLPSLVAQSYEPASIASLARKSVRNDGWDLRTGGSERPCAAVKPLRPLAATISTFATLAEYSGRNLARGRLWFLPVDALVCAYSLGLIWRFALRSCLRRVC